MGSLRLGSVDAGCVPEDGLAFFRERHEGGMRPAFRGLADDQWHAWREAPGSVVADLQRRLTDFGFPTGDTPSGRFDYRTESAARLFQEYVRSAEGVADIGTPDAVVGPRTRRHLDRWQREALVADWRSDPALLDPWLRLLSAYRDHTLAHAGPLHDVVRERSRRTPPPDSLPAEAWEVGQDSLHLIGIRRGAGTEWKIKLNNDVFVLLAGGGVFTFFGSTDPNPRLTGAPPFLVPGQHIYRFGWHKISQPARSYRAFRPRSAGVLVMRDRDNRRSSVNLHDERILASAVDPQPNPTINIHWSGRHTSNWSAGCQVIAGGAYINHRNAVVDCWTHASASYVGLGPGTRGAYDVLVDLAMITADDPSPDGTDLRYTLMNERDLDLEPAIGRTFASEALLRGLEVLERHAPQRCAQYRRALEAG